MVGHSISLTLELNRDFSLDEIKETLKHAPNIQLSQQHYTTPIEVVGSDDVLLVVFAKIFPPEWLAIVVVLRQFTSWCSNRCGRNHRSINAQIS